MRSINIILRKLYNMFNIALATLGMNFDARYSIKLNINIKHYHYGQTRL